MSATSEIRHPDFGGLLLQTDPVHGQALEAANFELPKPGVIAKRGGYRRVNHNHYAGAIFLIDDLQRICDYGKIIIGALHITEHDQPQPPITPVDPFFNPNPPIPPPAPPVLVMDAAPFVGDAPLLVQFSSAGSFDPNGGPLTYAWVFGDGAVSNQANPQHLYGADNTYHVTLTITNLAGLSATSGFDIVVHPTPVALAHWNGVSTPSTWTAGP